jgi:hypothetical protein
MAGLFLREQLLIERGEDLHGSHVGNGDVARIVRAPVSKGDQSGAGEGKSAAAPGACSGSEVIGDFLESAFDGVETNFGVALIVVTEIDTAVVGSPLRVLDIAVEFVRKRMRARAVAIHEVQLGGLMALVAVIVAGVGDELAVGRDSGRIVGAFAIGQRAK